MGFRFMATQYYVNRGSAQAHELDSVESVLDFLKENGEKIGELFVKDISGIKIKYSIITGRVSLKGADDPQNVTSFFSSEAFQNYTRPIADAICLLAKLELLACLYRLREDGTSQMIYKNHFDAKTEALMLNITLKHIDKTLTQIKRYLERSHQIVNAKQRNHIRVAMYHGLKNVVIENIKSINDVIRIMIGIKKEIKELKSNMSPRKSKSQKS